MDLSQIKTCDLVSELQKREGVEMQAAGPDEAVKLHVSGPATVLVIID